MGSLHQQSWLKGAGACGSEELFLTNCLTARRLGLWAASIMEFEGDRANAYANALVNDFVNPGPLDIVERLSADFRAMGLDISWHRILLEVDRQREGARRQVSLRVWQKAREEGGWERRVRPRTNLPPMIIPPHLKRWLDRNKRANAPA